MKSIRDRITNNLICGKNELKSSHSNLIGLNDCKFTRDFKEYGFSIIKHINLWIISLNSLNK